MTRGPLARYLRSLLAVRTIGALLALGGLLQVLDLLDTTTDILSRGQGLRGILQYSALRSPTVLLQALPIAALIGAVFSFSALAKQNEVVAMRAAGLPFRRAVLALLPVVLGVALLHALLAEVVVPRSQRALTAWWAQLPPSTDVENDVDENLLWFRSAGAIVGVATVLPDGRRLDQVRIYQRDEQGRMRQRIVADHARYAEHQWTLEHAVVTEFGDGHSLPVADTLRWDTPLRPADLQRLSAAEPYVSGGLASAVLAGEQSGIKTPAYYRTRIQHSFSDPLTALVMLLLATPVAVALTRGGAGGSQVLVALACGLGFLLVNGLLGALGQASLIGPVLASWVAPLGFIALGFGFLLRLDRN
jgi:lipopolysaccharide export system permease protein